jgi:hypothetical protein
VKKVIISDLDGTISLRHNRDPFDWAKAHEDTPNKAVVELLNDMLRLGFEVIVVTGRENRLREVSEVFLKAHLDRPVNLYMRNDGDSRPDEEVKLEIFEQHIKGRFEVRFVLDDRDRVVKMWRETIGLQAFQVAEGNF